MDKASRYIVVTALVLVLSDALITYFLKSVAEAVFPINAILPLLLILVLLRNGMGVLKMPFLYWFFLVLGIVGFTFGVALIPDVGYYRFLSLGAALSAFFVGYLFFYWQKDGDAVLRVFILIGCLYVLVCIVALSGLYPELFPVINAAWSDGREVHARPEVMADQNFQAFYFLPLVAVLPFVKRAIPFIIVVIGVIGAFYIVFRLQTRSGFIVLAWVLVFGWLSRIWIDRKISWRGTLFPIISSVFLVVYSEKVLEAANLLIIRMSDVGSGGLGRIDSTLYLLSRVLDVNWWVPQGNAEFIKSYGDLPHSNITAMFMEGGVLALIMWIMIFLYPLIRLMAFFVSRNIDDLGVLVLLVGLASMILQLTLNVPFYEQVWLWAGSVVAILQRCNDKRAHLCVENMRGACRNGGA